VYNSEACHNEVSQHENGSASYNWQNVRSSDHFVQFYEQDKTLIDSVSRFVVSGLRSGECCVVIASADHQADIDRTLAATGIDPATARSRHNYVCLDAAQTLSTFMSDGMPDSERFEESIGCVIGNLARSGKPIRAFGEMVNMLWSEGNHAGAIRLEQLWNDLASTRAFGLFCAYAMNGFNHEAHAEQFSSICAHHTQVIPAESYSVLGSQDDQLRQITLLQQKAKALEHEIARRIEVESLLIDSAVVKNRLAAIVDSSDDAIISKTLEGTITSWNGGAERIFGYTAEEVIGKPKTIVFPPELYHEEDEILAKLRRGERIDHFESVRVRKDGKRIDVSLSLSPIKDGRGKIVGASTIARDITDSKRQQRELETLNARLKRSITETHHRVKNNLQLMGALIDMQRQTERTSVPISDLLRLGQNIQALAVIHDILTHEAKEDGDIESISIKGILERLLPMMAGTVGDRRLIVKMDEASLPGKSTTALALIANELVCNAVKHGSGDVELTLTSDENGIVLAVCDDGPGFEEGFDPEICAHTGLDLIENIARYDLHAETCYRNREGGGARVSVSIKNQKP